MIIVTANGNLTGDPELRTTPSGKKVTSFSIASNEGKDNTEFVNCVAWEKTAELIAEYCKKGDRLCVSGRYQTEKYEKDGIQKSIVKIIVNQFDFPPKRSEAPQSAGYRNDDLEDEIPF